MGFQDKSISLTPEIPPLAAPIIEQPQPPIVPMPVAQGGNSYGHIGQYGYRVVQVLGGYDQAEYSQYHDGVDYKRLQFEPWKTENILGPKELDCPSPFGSK